MSSEQSSTTNPSTGQAAPTAPSALERWFPIAVWLPRYDWGKFLTADLIAALSVAALLIPESMGYATVAGLPVELGLYATPLALIGYAMFGGSRLMVFGTIGAVAAITGSILGQLAGGDQAVAVTMAAALALMTGVVFIVAGLLRMGWITNFMSRAVMAGFIWGMAVQIIVGQLGKLTGADVAGESAVAKFMSWLSQMGSWNMTATAIGAGGLILIFGMQRFVPKLPAALTAVAAGSLLVALLSPAIELVDRIPQGLPAFGLPTGLSLTDWATLLLGSTVVALVAFSEGWGASSKIAQTTGDQLNSNQEFVAYGVGNLGAGLLGGMGVGGSLSKSSAAMTAGAKSQMSNIFLAGMVLLTLLFFAPLFQWLPEAILAAVVINAMWESANPEKLRELWDLDMVDFVLGLITAVVALTFDLLPAMIVGVALSILYLIYRISFPTRAELGRLPETGDYAAMHWISGHRQTHANPAAQPVPNVAIYRFSAPLIFSNAEAFGETGRKLLIDAAAKDALPHTLVLDCEEMIYVDSTGAEAMSKLHEYAKRYNINLKLARVHAETLDLLDAAGVKDQIGPENFYATVRNAVDASV